jgi:hypothetical protein
LDGSYSKAPGAFLAEDRARPVRGRGRGRPAANKGENEACVIRLLANLSFFKDALSNIFSRIFVNTVIIIDAQNEISSVCASV